MTKTKYEHTAKLFCPRCGVTTDQVHLVNQYATKCLKCKSVIGSLERVSNPDETFYTPDGHPAKVIQNNSQKAIFEVESGQHAGLYVYDKTTGFGAIQNRGNMAS